MKQMTRKEAQTFAKSKIWQTFTHDQVVRTQLFQERICLPLDLFSKSLSVVLGRPVMLIEVAYNKPALIAEYLGEGPAPTFEDLVAMMPPKRTFFAIPGLSKLFS